MKRAIFLDRDGVINVDTPYVYKPKDFIFNPCLQLLGKLCIRHELMVIIVTNQSGIGRGLYTLAEYKVAEKFIENKLKEFNLHVTKLTIARIIQNMERVYTKDHHLIGNQILE